RRPPAPAARRGPEAPDRRDELRRQRHDRQPPPLCQRPSGELHYTHRAREGRPGAPPRQRRARLREDDARREGRLPPGAVGPHPGLNRTPLPVPPSTSTTPDSEPV